MNNKNAIDPQTKALKSKLTFRYALALTLIACTLIFSSLVLNTEIKHSEKYAHTINISGMQRMLSQRIALFSREIYHSSDASLTQELVTDFDAAVTKMRHNHQHLVSGFSGETTDYEISTAIRDIYFGDTNLAARVDEYIDLSEKFLEEFKQGGLDAITSNSTMNDIVKIARSGLLDDLDGAVLQYQREAEDSIAFFKNTEVVLVIAGLFLLLIEALFIFRPMVAKVSQNIRDLQTYNDELIEFSYRISHDLRAPIVSSLGLSALARTAVQKNQNETVLQAIDHIESSMVKLETLISDIINLTKLKLVNAPSEPIDCHTLVDETLSKLVSLPHFENIEIRKHIEITKPIMIKKILLQQNLENLISNSIKYIDPDKNNPYISINITQKNNDVSVEISDNGLGVPEKFQARLFQMFQRFHPEHSFGSGLGLYLVKQNTEALGGDIEYIATNDGSLFKMTFPEQ